MMCSSHSGSKPLFFQWLKDGHILGNHPDSRYKIENSDAFSLFIIDNINRNDAGNYSCVVRNAYGTDSQSTVLNVKGLIVIYLN